MLFIILAVLVNGRQHVTCETRPEMLVCIFARYIIMAAEISSTRIAKEKSINLNYIFLPIFITKPVTTCEIYKLVLALSNHSNFA